jgi:hypothetical protein
VIGPAWATNQVPGHPGTHRETLSPEKHKKAQKKKKNPKQNKEHKQTNKGT